MKFISVKCSVNALAYLKRFSFILIHHLNLRDLELILADYFFSLVDSLHIHKIKAVFDNFLVICAKDQGHWMLLKRNLFYLTFLI